MDCDLLLGTRAIGGFFGITEGAARQRIRRGQISPVFRIGRTHAARKSSLRAAIAAAETKVLTGSPLPSVTEAA